VPQESSKRKAGTRTTRKLSTEWICPLQEKTDLTKKLQGSPQKISWNLSLESSSLDDSQVVDEPGAPKLFVRLETGYYAEKRVSSVEVAMQKGIPDGLPRDLLPRKDQKPSRQRKPTNWTAECLKEMQNTGEEKPENQKQRIPSSGGEQKVEDMARDFSAHREIVAPDKELAPTRTYTSINTSRYAKLNQKGFRSPLASPGKPKPNGKMTKTAPVANTGMPHRTRQISPYRSTGQSAPARKSGPTNYQKADSSTRTSATSMRDHRSINESSMRAQRSSSAHPSRSHTTRSDDLHIHSHAGGVGRSPDANKYDGSHHATSTSNTSPDVKSTELGKVSRHAPLHGSPLRTRPSFYGSPRSGSSGRKVSTPIRSPRSRIQSSHTREGDRGVR
jgi:hypothetical protein